MNIKLLTEHHLEFLGLKRGCTAKSESTLVKMPHCWKSHVIAYILLSSQVPNIMPHQRNIQINSPTVINSSILKAIKDATGTNVIFPINISLIHFVFVLTSAPNVGERLTKT